jgi:hypothetical protein
MGGRHWWGLTLTLVAAAAVAGLGSAGASPSVGRAAEPAPVASLEPRETMELWREVVARRSRQSRPARTQQPVCRPLRAVFYAATDFLRLATKLGAAPSPCAQYYVSVPPLVADKTQMRPNAAWRIRALGPNFHALAEVHLATWTRWVASTGSSWHTAGVTARQRMAAAGFDVALGDSWVLNEMTTAIRRGAGDARANIREFLRGLYEGDGSRPTRGAVFVVGFGQRTGDVSLYQTNLQNWFTDTAFWTDMTTYVSDWTQEVYGDVRSWAVPGAPNDVRRDHLNDYLQHKFLLAGVGPATVDVARNFVRATYSPLANAAWERDTAYGWTMVPAEQMAAYVSAQVNALRYFGVSAQRPEDHGGFAWAPRNTTGMSPADFAARTGLVLDRLAAAIRDTGQVVDPSAAGSQACGPPGQNLWCTGDVDGARLTEAWKSFQSWTQSVLTIGPTAQTLTAGTPSAAMSLSLTTGSGLPATSTTALAVTLSSSSPRGAFSTSPAGPWSSTLALTIAPGTSTTSPFHYLDTVAGTPVLTATATGATSGTLTITVGPGPVTTLRVTPARVTVNARRSQRFEATGVDAHGNRFAVSATWSLMRPALGTLEPATGSSTTFTAERLLGSGSVVARVAGEAGTIFATATLRVAPAKLRIRSIRYRGRANSLLVSVHAVDVGGGPSVSGARVALLFRRDGKRHVAHRALTGPAGRVTFAIPARQGRCFTAAVQHVNARGYTWDGQTPANRFCRRR